MTLQHTLLPAVAVMLLVSSVAQPAAAYYTFGNAFDDGNGNDCSSYDNLLDSCLADSRCSYCCETNTCGSVSYIDSVCSTIATQGNKCDAYCPSTLSCNTCMQVPGCMYCGMQGGQCMSSGSTCYEGEAVYCAPDPWNFSWRPIIIAAGALLGTFLFVVVLTLLWARRRRNSLAAQPLLAQTGGVPTAPQPAPQNGVMKYGFGDAVVDAEESGAEETTQLSLASSDEEMCQLCMERRAVVVFLPCYHAYCCESCSERVRPKRNGSVECPFCRTPIEAMLNLKKLPTHVYNGAASAAGGGATAAPAPAPAPADATAEATTAIPMPLGVASEPAAEQDTTAEEPEE